MTPTPPDPPADRPADTVSADTAPAAGEVSSAGAAGVGSPAEPPGAAGAARASRPAGAVGAGSPAGAVPAGTAFRFVTLIGVAVAITLFVADSLSETVFAGRGLARARCLVLHDLYPATSGAPDPDGRKWQGYYDCLNALRGGQLLWLAGGLVLLALVSWVIYQVQPWWRIRRGRLVELRAVPALWARVEPSLVELTRRAGLGAVPEFRLDPGSPRAGGVAFGTHRRPVVALDVGLVLLHGRDRPAFDAVVLHELAHLRHRDVPMTYATIAVWRAVLVVAVLPYLWGVGRAVYGGLGWVASTVTLVLWFPVLLALAYAARTSVLRAREFHADALVVRWTGDADPYRTLPEVRAPRLTAHPSRAARLAATGDPRVLLRPGFWPFFLGAVTWQVLTGTAEFGLSGLWVRSDTAGPHVVRVCWSVGVAVLVCLAAWRGAAYRRAGGGRSGVFLRPGAGLGLGLALGTLLVPTVVLDERGPQLSPITWGLLAVGAVVAALVCGWAGWCAVLLGDRLLDERLRGGRVGGGRPGGGWLGSGRPSGGWGVAGVAAAVLVVCWSCLGWLLTAHGYAGAWSTVFSPALDRLDGLAGGGADSVVVRLVFLAYTGPGDRFSATAALALVWLVPALLARPPRAAFTAGGVGAVGAVVAVVLAGLGGLGTPEGALVRTAWQVVAVVAVQVVVAGAARRAGVVAALVAAWLTGVAGGVAIWVAHWSGGGVDAVVARQPWHVLPFTAVVAAVLAAALPRRQVTAQQAEPWQGTTAQQEGSVRRVLARLAVLLRRRTPAQPAEPPRRETSAQQAEPWQGTTAQQEGSMWRVLARLAVLLRRGAPARPAGPPQREAPAQQAEPPRGAHTQQEAPMRRVLARLAVLLRRRTPARRAVPPRGAPARPVTRVALVPVVVLTVAVLVPQPPAPSAVALLPTEPPAPRQLDPVAAMALWAQGGGQVLLNDVVQAQGRAFLGMAAGDRPAQVARCAELGDRIADARRFPGPPVPVAREHWDTGLDASLRGARECTRVFAAPSGDPNPVTEQFTAATTEFLSLLRLLPFGEAAVRAATPSTPPAPTTTAPPVDLATLLLTAADLPPGFTAAPPAPKSELTTARPECTQDNADVGPQRPVARAEVQFGGPGNTTISQWVFRYPAAADRSLAAIADLYARCARYSVSAGDITLDIGVRVLGGTPWAAEVTYGGAYLTLYSREVFVVRGDVLSVVSFHGRRPTTAADTDRLVAAMAAKLGG
ncbi:M48 family metalloprotease [Actinokineospora sp. PR83]|uniref:M48 family metalloprotease n=1 Tax=Actinokineospora sp. PR83 TaxID=2884908 RepID=UPI0027E1FFF6|nr:M48 family metalloprotease [Actinokineospora sp. PR83]MCG8915659.1 M48 family metalloprotease [Actinokineospora sp. PR83]